MAKESDEALPLGYGGGDRSGLAPDSLSSTLPEEAADHQRTLRILADRKRADRKRLVKDRAS